LDKRMSMTTRMNSVKSFSENEAEGGGGAKTPTSRPRNPECTLQRAQRFPASTAEQLSKSGARDIVQKNNRR
jgi:hypothetical protein